MKTIVPAGDRVFVVDLEPEVSLVKRAEKAGLYINLLSENVPQPTTGRVVAIGSGPMIQDMCRINDIVCFARHAGVYQQVEGKEYRCLEWREIISVIRDDSQTSALESPNPTSS